MKRFLSVVILMLALICNLSITSLADNETIYENSYTVDNIESSIIEESASNNYNGLYDEPVQEDLNNKNQRFIDGMRSASDLTPEVAEASRLISGITKVAAFIVQIISYTIIVFLAVRVVVDLLYITLPVFRSILANGYGGTSQSAGNMQNPVMGMGSMGMRPGMGAMGGMPMGQGSGLNGAGMNSNMVMPNQRNSIIGKIQWVSNAALNAVASESAVGPDGKSQSAFKIYIKDMIVVLVVTPVLLVLAATGALTNFGLTIAGALVQAIVKLSVLI